MSLLKQNLLNFFLVFFAVLLFIFSAWRGFNNGKLEKQSEVVLKNAFIVQQGLDYFLNDYERFPQAGEFENNQLMKDYFSSFPPKEFVSKVCGKSWVYTRATPLNYAYSYCLSRSVEDEAQGWHKITESARLK